MSKKKKTSKKETGQAEATTEDATFESVLDQPSAAETIEKESASPESASPEPFIEATTADVEPQKRGGGFVAWLALIAALLALVAFGVDFFVDRGATGDDRENDVVIGQQVAAVQDSVASLQQNVTALSDQLAARDSEIAAIERRFSDRLRQIESLPGRMAAIEGTVSSLQGISTGARDAWLLAEVEYYMQIANAQLQLAGNPHLASLALGLADERLTQMANPALTDIRRALSLELRSLDIMEKPDTEGITLTLASLAAVVDSLPLQQEVALTDEGEIAALDPELTGMDRALASMKSAIDSAISVRRVDESVQPLIAPESQYFLRANLALQLQAARLAVLRGEETIFRQSLDDAASWLTEYFDTGSAAVRSSLQTIAEIRGSAFSVAAPDISESLHLLRQFTAFSEATAAPVADPSQESIADPSEEPVVEPEQ
jgi:uroporphyrin-3 C-methyltransferase